MYSTQAAPRGCSLSADLPYRGATTCPPMPHPVLWASTATVAPRPCSLLPCDCLLTSNCASSSPTLLVPLVPHPVLCALHGPWLPCARGSLSCRCFACFSAHQFILPSAHLPVSSLPQFLEDSDGSLLGGPHRGGQPDSPGCTAQTLRALPCRLRCTTSAISKCRGPSSKCGEWAGVPLDPACVCTQQGIFSLHAYH